MTTLQLRRLIELNAEGLNDRQIGEALGIGYRAAYWWRRKLGLRASHRVGDDKDLSVYDYTVYDARTDDVLACGSARECAKSLGIKMASFYSMLSRVKRGGNRKYEIEKAKRRSCDD